MIKFQLRELGEGEDIHTFANEEDIVGREEGDGGFEVMGRGYRGGGDGLNGRLKGLSWLGGIESRTFARGHYHEGGRGEYAGGVGWWTKQENS